MLKAADDGDERPCASGARLVIRQPRPPSLGTGRRFHQGRTAAGWVWTWTIMIFSGATEADMANTVIRADGIGPDTKVTIDPKLKS